MTKKIKKKKGMYGIIWQKHVSICLCGGIEHKGWCIIFIWEGYVKIESKVDKKTNIYSQASFIRREWISS